MAHLRYGDKGGRRQQQEEYVQALRHGSLSEFAANIVVNLQLSRTFAEKLQMIKFVLSIFTNCSLESPEIYKIFQSQHSSATSAVGQNNAKHTEQSVSVSRVSRVLQVRVF